MNKYFVASLVGLTLAVLLFFSVKPIDVSAYSIMASVENVFNYLLTKVWVNSFNRPDIVSKKVSQKISFTRLSHNVFLAPNDGSLTTPELNSDKGGEIIGDVVLPTKISKAFYSSNPDIYDFMVIVAPSFPSPGFDGNSPVRNSVQGIGKLIEDNSFLYGSKSTLKSLVTFYNIESNLSQLVHEISHQWLTYIPNSTLVINRDGSHWSQFMDTATRENGLMYFSPNGGNPFIDNGDGTFSLDSVTPLPLTSYHKFNSMELYLMGLIPDSHVQPLMLWETNSLQVAETMTGTKKSITVHDVIKMIGQRNPSYPKTQKDFKIAYIILPKKDENIDAVIIDKIKKIANDLPKEWNFATGGLSNLK